MPRRPAIVASVAALLVVSALPDSLRATGRVNLSRFVAHVDAEAGPVSTVIPGNAVIELCRDEDGCTLTLRVEHALAFVAARPHLYFRSGTNEYKVETYHGFDGANGTETVFVLTDGANVTCTISDIDTSPDPALDLQPGFVLVVESEDDTGRCDLSISD